MVYHYLLVDDLEKKKMLANDLKNEISSYLKEKNEIVKQMKELKAVQQDVGGNIEILSCKETELDRILKNTELKLEEFENFIKNTKTIQVINVDVEVTCFLNGLVDLNRDIIMKLIKIIKDELKIRNIIGMNKLFHSWCKKPIFRWARFPINLPLELLPNPKAKADVEISENKFTTHVKDGVKYGFFFSKELSNGIFNVMFESQVSYQICGLSRIANASHFMNSLDPISDSCYIFSYGITSGNKRVLNRVLDESLFNDDGGLNIILEFDARKKTEGKLHFFVNGVQIPHVVTNIPQPVHFFFGVYRALHLEVKSFRQLIEPTADDARNSSEYMWK